MTDIAQIFLKTKRSLKLPTGNDALCSCHAKSGSSSSSLSAAPLAGPGARRPLGRRTRAFHRTAPWKQSFFSPPSPSPCHASGSGPGDGMEPSPSIRSLAHCAETTLVDWAKASGRGVGAPQSDRAVVLSSGIFIPSSCSQSMRGATPPSAVTSPALVV